MSTTLSRLPRSERPYEKLERSGVKALSDAELIAILLRTGTKSMSALDLSRLLIHRFGDPEGNGGLAFLHDLSLDELKEIDGIGRVKAIQIQAALELGIRSSYQDTKKRRLLNTPKKVAAYISPILTHEPREQMFILALDSKSRLMKHHLVQEGGLQSIVISPRDLFREAIRANAAAIILVHNHPSGDPTPSPQDIASTKTLLEASRLLGVPLQDHIVVGHEGYVSIREQTLIWDA